MGISRHRRLGIVALVAALGACSSPQGVNPNMVVPGPRDDAGGDPAQACGQVLEAPLGKVGNLLVWNTQDTLFVRLSGISPWQLTESHAHAGTAAPGNWWTFPAQAVHDPYVATFTYAFALADLGVSPGDTLHVAGHAFLMTPSYRFAEAQGQVEFVVQRCGNVPPQPGKDIVVFNDINPFDDTGMANPNNQLMVKNLVVYTTAGPRNDGTKVLFDRGRQSRCGGTGECSDPSLTTMRSVIQAQGFSIEELNSTQESITAIAPEVKVIFLWNPRETFTNAEINVLKAFAAEGGRVVFIGEWQGYYDAITLENDFLGKMGAVMTNIGEAVDCGYNTLPGTSLRPHQITQGMTDVTIACSSVLVPGPNDYPLYYDSTNTRVLSAVATIDTTPLPLGFVQPARVMVSPQSLHPLLNPSSATGY
ncbi:ABC transporter [Thermus caldilimi]|uniref:ABC transporter n=1 Tax=Thermus caldilimi TaxID=2483360 RepID=UPI001F0E1D9D|nr:ABC transporter [Thermus caldilimi]